MQSDAPSHEPHPDHRPVLVLDAYALVYRSFFGLPPMTTSKGEPTGALYGLCVLLLKLLRERRPRGVCVALDVGRTFRHDAFAVYKAHRPSTPEALSRQLERLPAMWDAFGFPAFSAPGFEADDVCATLSRELRAENEAALVVTGDLDALQCTRHGAQVLVVTRGETKARIYDEAAVRARFGVSPADLPDWKALAGDVTDGLPGVPGVGAKTATALLQRFGSLDGLLARLADVQPLRVREALAQRKAQLELHRDLARLRDDVPLPAGARSVPLDAVALPRVRAMFEALEMRSLLPRLEPAFAGA